jgi:hypothetical protein
VAVAVHKAVSMSTGLTTRFCQYVCHESVAALHSLNFLADFNKQFTAKVGAKADVVDSRKNCQLNLKLEYDSGFSFSVYQADYSGWADLDDGVTGTVKATYYFSGQQDQVSLVNGFVYRNIRR